MDDFLRHVDHVVTLIGSQHIGLSSDHSEGYDQVKWEALFSRTGMYSTIASRMGDWYTYDTRFVQNAGSCVDLPHVNEIIAKLGFGEEEFVGILGGNFLRIFEQVWGSTS